MLKLLALPVTLLVVALVAIGCSDPHAITSFSRSSTDASTEQRAPATVARLDPDLRAAVRAAIRDARADGVAMHITSGWRSRAHQQRLFDEAVTRYGSVDEARRYVSTPDTSAHVTGDAVDIGPTEADDWLIRHGSDYGLCQVFANEIWHFELATEPGQDCPPMLPDSSYRG